MSMLSSKKALSSSPGNVYANVMFGYWVLIGRGVTVQDITLAQSKFAIALSSNDERDICTTVAVLKPC